MDIDHARAPLARTRRFILPVLTGDATAAT
jgi:hypothetical protein